MANQEKNFANGFILTRRSGAPDYVVGNVAINVQEFTEWLNTYKNEKGWVNLNLMQSQGGKFYAEQNTWQPEQGGATKAAAPAPAMQTNDDDDFPF